MTGFRPSSPPSTARSSSNGPPPCATLVRALARRLDEYATDESP
ncbi:hypothetical protein ACRAWF_33125 [Streptomyces sp. L7]